MQVPSRLLDEYLLEEIRAEGSARGVTVPELEQRIARRVRAAVDRLHSKGKIERTGVGNNGDVYTYHAKALKLRRL